MEEFIVRKAEELINEDYLEYSTYVTLHRAFPDLRDGMKPVHRRILWAMYVNKYFNLTKNLTIEGRVAEYHPHGSSYQTIVNMVQKDGNNIPLLIGKGNFAQHTSSELMYAHQRYTECKLSEIAKDMVKNLKQVNMSKNYDGTKDIPEVLPVDYPSVLCYNNQGIAVGYKCQIPSFNLIEVCNATIKHLSGEKYEPLYPDFATKGYILEDDKAIRECDRFGGGKFVLRGNIYKDGNSLVIDEIPYNTSREAICRAIEDLATNKKITDIKDILDLTDLHGMRVEIICKKGADLDTLINLIYSETPLQTTYTSSIGVIHDGQLKYYGVNTIIKEWCSWKRECIIKEKTEHLQHLIEKGHLLSGFEKVCKNLDEAVNIIRFNKTPINDLMAMFNIDEQQAIYVNSLPINKFNINNLDKTLEDLKKLREEYKDIMNIINNKDRVNDIIIKGLNKTIKDYGIERNTTITNFDKNVKVDIDNIVDTMYLCHIALTKDGYIYKTTGRNRDDITLKPNDSIIFEKDDVRSDGEILIFKDTDCYKIQLNDIPITKSGSMGTYEKNLKNNHGCILDDNTKAILIIYKNGRVALINANSYRTKTKRTKLANSVNNELSVLKVLSIDNTHREINITYKSRNSEAKKTFNTKDLTMKTARDTQGVKIINQDIINVG